MFIIIQGSSLAPPGRLGRGSAFFTQTRFRHPCVCKASGSSNNRVPKLKIVRGGKKAPEESGNAISQPPAQEAAQQAAVPLSTPFPAAWRREAGNDSSSEDFEGTPTTSLRTVGPEHCHAQISSVFVLGPHWDEWAGIFSAVKLASLVIHFITFMYVSGTNEPRELHVAEPWQALEKGEQGLREGGRA